MTKRPAKTDYDKLFEKAKKCAENYCRICGRDLYGSESDVYVTETKRKSICLFHQACIIKEARSFVKGTKILRFTEVQHAAQG